MRDFKTIKEVDDYFHNGTFMHKGYKFRFPIECEDIAPFGYARIMENIIEEIDRIEEYNKNPPERLWDMLMETGFPSTKFPLSTVEMYYEAKRYQPPPLRTIKEIMEEIKRKEAELNE